VFMKLEFVYAVRSRLERFNVPCLFHHPPDRCCLRQIINP
jgi:hypothetical protein